MSTFWDILAGVGLLIADFAAVVAAIGTAAMLIVHGINVVAKRRVLYVPNVFLHWSGTGLGIGILTATALALTSSYDRERIGIIFRLSFSTIVMLLAAALVMLVLAIILRRVMPRHAVR